MQERLLGEDGHPRKVQEGEDPHRMGLVLEWVYGTIVSTAGKARSGTRCALGELRALGGTCAKSTLLWQPPSLGMPASDWTELHPAISL